MSTIGMVSKERRATAAAEHTVKRSLCESLFACDCLFDFLTQLVTDFALFLLTKYFPSTR